MATRRNDQRATAKSRLYETKNDLPEATRREVVGLLNARLADCVDLEAQCKQAHWNVKGENFIALHRLFDDIHEQVTEYADLLAERIVQLGSVAKGTAREVAEQSALDEYPLTIAKAEDHAKSLAAALAGFAARVRFAISEMDELEDAVSADICTEIARGSDKWLWMIEAHIQ